MRAPSKRVEFHWDEERIQGKSVETTNRLAFEDCNRKKQISIKRYKIMAEFFFFFFKMEKI